MWQNILQSFQQELNTLSNTWSFAPAWAVWGVLLIGVFAVACFVHAVALAFLNRILRQRRPHLIRLLTATKNPTRLALLLIALAAALPTAPLGPDGRLIFIRCLVLGTIFMIGWTALKVLHIGANLYLRNFHIDAPDNLLARKHVTQVRVLVRVLDTIIVLLTLGSALMTFDIARQYGISLFASAGVAGQERLRPAPDQLCSLRAFIQGRCSRSRGKSCAALWKPCWSRAVSRSHWSRRLPVATHYADRAVAACRGDRYHMPRTCPGRRRSAWSAGRRREPARRGFG